MDNLTHSLIGVAFARALPARLRRPEIYWTSVIANNIPDADLLLRLWPGTSSLDSLVHHRGWTHTLLLAPALGAVSAAIGKRIAKAPRGSVDLLAVGVAGCLLHIGADSLNSYGVHPFTPFFNRWYYGDSLFIVEPLLWFALIPFVAQEATRAWARAGWWIVAAAMLALLWLFPLFTSGHALLLTAFLVCMSALQRRTRSRWAMVAATAAVVGGFAASSANVKSAIAATWGEQAPGEKALEITATPAPGNPFCWSAWIASRDRDRFIFRSAEIALLPSLVSIDRCPSATPPAHSVELVPESLRSTAGVRWENRYAIGIEEWRRAVRESCTLRRLLSFARFPFLRTLPDGTRIAGDLRYDREPGVGFAEVALPAGEDCSIPEEAIAEDFPWEPPFTSRAIESKD